MKRESREKVLVGAIAYISGAAACDAQWFCRPRQVNAALSALARFLLDQVTLHVLRQDAAMRQWFDRVKRRRGAKIARVAVMRRLTLILWHMLRNAQPYKIACAAQRAAKDDHRERFGLSLYGQVRLQPLNRWQNSNFKIPPRY